MQVMILAAGRSTRLGTLGLTLPKPLLPVCGYPAVSYALALCRQAGLHDIVINLHHHGDKLGKTLGDGSQFGVNLRYSVEEELLGTGGGVGKARTLFSSEPVLVINGKVAADSTCVGRRRPRAGAAGNVATMVLRADPTSRTVGAHRRGCGRRVMSIRGQHEGGAAMWPSPRACLPVSTFEPRCSIACLQGCPT